MSIGNFSLLKSRSINAPTDGNIVAKKLDQSFKCVLVLVWEIFTQVVCFIVSAAKVVHSAGFKKILHTAKAKQTIFLNSILRFQISLF